MRMTRRVKPPTAAVTITNTWPWSDAMSDAKGSGEDGRRKEDEAQGQEGKMPRRKQGRRMAREF